MRTTYRVLAGLLASVGSLSFVVAGCASNANDSETQATTNEEAVSGAVGDWTGFQNGQCVHGVYAFYAYRYGISLTGTCAQPGNVGICENCGACMIWESARVEPPASLFNRYAWGTTMPQTYDIVVYPPRTSALGPGHVAAVDHITSSDPSDWHALYVMDSNWYGNEKMATAVHTVTRAPYGIYRLKSLDNPAPRGYLDGATCTAIDGWAQDPSVATSAIATDLWFDGPAGNASATKVEVEASAARSDLCTPLGSCNHAYSLATPRSTLDGKAHTVYAYGIDSKTSAGTILTNAPKTYTCDAPAIPRAVAKRAIASPDVVTAWHFSLFEDMATYASADIDAVASGTAFDVTPKLVQVTGDKNIYVVDGTERRLVADTTSFDAWRFTTSMVTAIDASALAAMTTGKDWPTTPLLVKASDADTVYVLDGELPPPPQSDAGVPNDFGDPGGDSNSPSDEPPQNGDASGAGSSSGCSVARAGDDDASYAWGALPFAALIFVRRRRARKG